MPWSRSTSPSPQDAAATPKPSNLQSTHPKLPLLAWGHQTIGSPIELLSLQGIADPREMLGQANPTLRQQSRVRLGAILQQEAKVRLIDRKLG